MYFDTHLDVANSLLEARRCEAAARRLAAEAAGTTSRSGDRASAALRAAIDLAHDIVRRPPRPPRRAPGGRDQLRAA